MSDKIIKNIVIGVITIVGLLVTKEWWCAAVGVIAIACYGNND